MIKKIKKLFDFHERFDDLKSRSNEILAYQHLSRYLPDKYFTKTSYSMNYVPILQILNDIIIYKPSKVLEFGGGVSTIILSKAITDLKLKTNLYTVDNDLSWLSYIKESVSENQCLNLCHCPIKNHENKSFTKWYDLSGCPVLMDKNQFDMIIIDGPWSKIAPNARYGAVEYILSNNRNSNLIVYVDDIDRADELAIFNDLRIKLNLKGVKYYRYGRLSNQNNIETRPFKL